MSTYKPSRFGQRFGPRTARLLFTFWPAIRNTGVRVTHIADDWSRIDTRLPLNWRTRNYVGTIFGGSIYGSVDPFLMLILMRRMGPDYVVWDKAATVRFRRPAKRTLYASHRVDDSLLAELRTRADAEGSFDWTTTFDLTDADGVAHATIDKVLYIATRATYNERLAARAAQTSPS